MNPVMEVRVLALAVALVAGLAAPVAAQAPATCMGREVTIRGTDGRDSLEGTERDDVIHGGGGADRIEALGGDDWVCTGPGGGTVLGGDGHDRLLGGPDGDEIFTDAGDDDVRGRGSGDTLFGGPGADTIRGGRGNDDIQGGTGPDRMFGAAGADRFQGAGGAEVYFGPDEEDDLIDGGPGARDLLEAFETRDGKAQVERVDLEAGVSTGAGHDELHGIEDVEVTGEGAVVLGNDDANDLRVYLGVARGRGGDDSVAYARRAYGGAGADFVGGSPEDDQLYGGSGRDALDGAGGSDEGDGGGGRDSCRRIEIETSCEA